MRCRTLLLLAALGTLNACSLITAPISAAGHIAGSTVKATGNVAAAGIGAMGRQSPPPPVPQPQPQQPYYPQPQAYYPPQQAYYPPQQRYYPTQPPPQGYWYNGAWYPSAPTRR